MGVASATHFSWRSIALPIKEVHNTSPDFPGRADAEQPAEHRVPGDVSQREQHLPCDRRSAPVPVI